MAIYHCSIKIIGRSAGRSAVAAAAYRSGTALYDEEIGQKYDFTKKGGVVYSHIQLPDHAPREYEDREKLWNAVQRIEKQSRAQLAREVEVALPVEMDREQQLLAVYQYVQENFVSEGMCADWSLHDKGDGNPHAHIMLTTRAIKEDGEWATKEKKTYKLDANGERIPVIDKKTGQQKIGKNNRKMWERVTVQTNDWNDKGKAEIWRGAWAKTCNQYLAPEQKIDHRSYERQGVERIPTIHEGYAAREIEKRGGKASRSALNREIKEGRRVLEEEVLKPLAEAQRALKEATDALLRVMEEKARLLKEKAKLLSRSFYEVLVGADRKEFRDLPEAYACWKRETVRSKLNAFTSRIERPILCANYSGNKLDLPRTLIEPGEEPDAWSVSRNRDVSVVRAGEEPGDNKGEVKRDLYWLMFESDLLQGSMVRVDYGADEYGLKENAEKRKAELERFAAQKGAKERVFYCDPSTADIKADLVKMSLSTAPDTLYLQTPGGDVPLIEAGKMDLDRLEREYGEAVVKELAPQIEAVMKAPSRHRVIPNGVVASNPEIRKSVDVARERSAKPRGRSRDDDWAR